MAVNKEEALSLYLSGLSGGKVAAQLGCTQAYVSKLVREAGLTRPSSTLDHEEVVRLFRELGTARAVSARLGVTPTTVGRVLKSSGVANNYKPRTDANERFFATIDSPDKAYWLGFIVADGCLLEEKYGYRLQIGLQGSDSEQLHKFNTALGLSRPHPRTGWATLKGKRYPTVTTSVRSKAMGEDLLALGVEPRKSKREKVNLSRVPEEFHRDLWRGFVDGDGHVSGAGGKARLVVWGSAWMLTEFRAYASSLTTSSASVRALKAPHVGLHRFELAGHRALPVINDLYRDADTALDRKAEAAAFATLVQGK